MEYKIEYQRRFTEVLRNINPGIYLPIVGKYEKYNPDYSDVTVFDGSLSNDDYGTSPLNTPYWDQIKLKTDGDEPIEYRFPNDPMVDFSQQKKFAETKIFGGGNIIESAGLKDPEIRIIGVLWDNTRNFPESQLIDLLEVFREGTSLKVESSRYFLHYGISDIFIKSLKTHGVPGFPDSEYFVIHAKGIQPVELEMFEQ